MDLRLYLANTQKKFSKFVVVPELLKLKVHQNPLNNQSGFVKDRSFVPSIFDLMNFALKENIPGLMIILDFHKAFDSVEWNYLVTFLEAFRLGLDIIRWVKTLYKNIQSCVINNGLENPNSE